MNKFLATDNRSLIRGKTIINHKKRIKFDITTSEYCFLEAVETIIKKYKKFHAKNNYMDMYKINGFTFNEYKQLGRILISKDLIKNNNNLLIISDDWLNYSLISEKDFEELWLLLGKVGNKRNALEMYSRAIKEVTDHKHLIERAKLYLKYLASTEQFQMHISSWLNPKYMKFDDEYKINQKKGEDEGKSYKGKF